MDTPGTREIGTRNPWGTFTAFEQAVRRAGTETQALQLAAEAVIECELYRCIVLSLHDDQGNLGAIGYAGVPSELIEAARRAPRVRKEVREAVLKEEHRLGQSYFIPVEAGIDLTDEARHIPSAQSPDPMAEWRAGDELFTPLRRSDGGIMGFSSVDEPFDRRRPTTESIRFLELIISRAAAAVEHLGTLRGQAAIEERIQRIVANAEDVIYQINAATRSFTMISPAIQILTGVDSAELVGLATGDWIRRFVHPDDREMITQHYLELGDAALGGTTRPAVCEYRVRRQSGVVRWVREKTWASTDEDGQVITFEGLIRDITPVRSLSGQLERTEQRYHLIADNARDLIYTRDVDGAMTYVSPSVTDYLGISPEEFLNSHFSSWLNDSPRNRIAFEAFNAALESTAIASPFTLELRGPDSRTILMEFNESLIHDEFGRVIGAQGVGRDITEREELLNSLRTQSERADASNVALKSLVSESRRRQQKAIELSRQLRAKNKELESFVHIVSHDLRAPLITLQGLSGQLRRRYARLLDERGREITLQLGAEAKRLMRLITGLLDYARAGSDESARRAVDLGLVTESVWTRLTESGLVGDSALRCPDSPILVWADPVALERVMENLLSNALIHRDPIRPVEIELSWESRDGQIEVAIRDNGRGVDPDDRDRIFELFFRGQGAEAPGSGLGLAIVKRIMEASSGSVSYEPNPGGGSTFYVRWPAHPTAFHRPASTL